MSRSVALVVLLLSAPVFAGCIAGVQEKLAPSGADAPVDLTDLAATGAKGTVDNADGTRTFQWEGKGPGGVNVVLGVRQIGPASPKVEFEVDPRVGFVSVDLAYSGDTALQAFLVDDQGRIQCGTVGAKTQTCNAPLPSNLTNKTKWGIVVGAGYEGGLPGEDYKVAATLHPLSHLVRGDPLAGIDTSIRFRVVDPKAGGSESNIGVLPDGAVFAQFGLKTMLSKDDGATWKDVSAPTTNKITLDPMLYVDPWSKTVYVDQLYIGCSILAWSTDEGASWLTNPAACGLPSDDHQKIVTGPHQVPGAPCPMVYYSWSSITVGASGVFVARSYDCGLHFITAKVVDTTGGAQYDNDMLAADRKGNVFVPMYMCDKGGYVAVGVSNDYGATFTMKTVDTEKEACLDADPGFAVDSDDTAYVVYHRPSGIKESHSTDHGKTWSEPRIVSPAGLKSFVHVDGVGGDPGKLAVLYRATADTDKGPDKADGWAAWNMYVTFIENATDAAGPTLRTAIVNDPADPTQRGSVCTQGVACAGGNRNLLDFVDIAVGPDGRVYVVYADGCDKTCDTPADSRKTTGPVGILEDGPRLFADGAPWAKAKSSLLFASAS